MDDRFENKGKDQNNAQGDGAIGKQVNNYGISPEVFAQYVKELGATEQLVNGFFTTLLEQEVPRNQWDSKLREIAAIHKELLARLEIVQSEDPQVVKLKQEAKQAIEAGDYAKAERMLENIAKQYSISAAETYVELARLQRIQLRYAKAAEYWQKAATLLPQESKKERADYLNDAGYNLYSIASYSEALPLYEQSLVISREIGGEAEEGTLLNNISQIYYARGDYDTALTYLEQSLSIRRKIGDQAGEGTTLNSISGIHWAQGNYGIALKFLEQSLAIRRKIGDQVGESATLSNIGTIYYARGNHDTALKNLEQSLSISQEIGDRAGKGVTLNNIGQIYRAQGDDDTALKFFEQSLSIGQEIGNRRQESDITWNIGCIYIKQGDLAKAEQYITQTVQLMDQIGHPKKDECRELLEKVRTKLRSR